MRAECLDLHWFNDLREAKQRIEAWRQEYNESCPHGALGKRTPVEYASEIAAREKLTNFITAGNSLSDR
jgi:putative transposase